MKRIARRCAFPTTCRKIRPGGGLVRAESWAHWVGVSQEHRLRLPGQYGRRTRAVAGRHGVATARRQPCGDSPRFNVRLSPVRRRSCAAQESPHGVRLPHWATSRAAVFLRQPCSSHGVWKDPCADRWQARVRGYVTAPNGDACGCALDLRDGGRPLGRVDLERKRSS